MAEGNNGNQRFRKFIENGKREDFGFRNVGMKRLKNIDKNIKLGWVQI